MGHDAFISYSHAADSTLAPRLQDGLQRMAKPWWRRRSLHVFRDTTGLSANPGLWSSIEAAMDDAEWFVFLASPEAAASPWVQREIAHWLSTKGPDQLLPVVTDGTWVWDSGRDDFDWEASTAVPAALAGAFVEEPRHVDMSWARSEEQLDLRNGRFRDQIAEIAAPIHGVAKDDLEGADVRQHRRTLRWAWGAAAALLMLVFLSGVTGVAAWQNANQAEQARAEAVANAAEAAEQAEAALAASARADENAVLAANEAEAALTEKERADARTEEARSESERAEAEKRTADEQRQIALDKTAEAETEASRARAARDAESKAADLARSEAARAEAAADEARRQRSAAEVNARRASEKEAEAVVSAQVATASQRETARALQDEQAAKAAEEKQKLIAQEQTRVATAAQRAAEVAEGVAVTERAAALAARDAEALAREQAETEALASASKAQSRQDGPLSLLLAVEAASRNDPGAISATDPLGRFAARLPTQSATGRRALFEAVTAAQGGADAYRVDRYLPFPADFEDPPVLLWKPVISDDGRYLAAAELADSFRGLRGPVPTRVFLWDLSDPAAPVVVLAGHQDQVVQISFAAGGRTLVTQDVAFSATSATSRVWDVASGAQLLAAPGEVFISPTGDHLGLQTIDTSIPGAPLVEVQFFDALTGAPLSAPKPGRFAIDDLTRNRSNGVQHPPYVELPFSADGRYALGESNGIAVLWDLERGGGTRIELIGPFALSSASPRVSPDGSVAVAFEDGVALAFFDLSSGATLGAFPITDSAIQNAVWNNDGTRLATLDAGGQIIVFDFDGDDDDGFWADTVAAPGELGFTADGRHLTVTIAVPGALGAYVTAVHDAATGSLIGYFEGELLAVSQASPADYFFRRADDTLAVIAASSPVDQRAVLTDGIADASTAVSMSPSGRWFASSNASGVRVWDLWAGTGPIDTAGVTAQAFGLTFEPGADRLVGVGLNGVPTRWDLERIGAGTRLGTVTPDSSVLADGVTALEPINERTALRFRNLVTGATRAGPILLRGERVDYVLVGPDGSPLVVNLDTGGALVARVDGSTIGRTTNQVATVSRSGARLVERGPGRTVVVRATSDLSVVAQIDLSELDDDDLDFGDSVALDPDGELLAATNATGATVVWDVASGQVVTKIPGRSVDALSFPLWGLAFSPDGERLVVKSPSNNVRMYQVSSADRWAVLATQQLSAEYAGRVVFSPDGAIVAIDGLNLLDGRTLAPIATLLAGPGAVTRFSSDGRSLVTVASAPLRGDDQAREVMRWSVDADELITQACQLAGRNLSIDEWNRYLGGSGAPYRRTCP